jgi:tetraacyldisaccharide 4'-kinase
MNAIRVVSLNGSFATFPGSRRVAAFCAVGNPQSFFKQLRQEGYETVLEKSFLDHHSYTQKEIDSLTTAATAAGAEALITTAKDAVKLQSLKFAIPCYVVEIEIAIEDEDRLRELIHNAAFRTHA